VLVGVELFILPAFGFPGFVGFAMILASIVLSFLPDSVSLSILWRHNYGGATEGEVKLLTEGLSWAALTLVIIIAAVVTAFIKGAKLPGLSRLALRAEVPEPAVAGGGSLPPAGVAPAETQTAVSQPVAPETLLGQHGVTET